MASIVIFFALCALVVIALLAFTAYKSGSIKNMKAHFKRNGALRDWKSLLLVAAMFIFGLFFISSNLKARELTTFNYAEVYAGMDYAYNGSKSNACDYTTLDSELSQRLTSNAGVKLNVISYKDLEINGKYTHHSCAIESDDKTYDALGFEFAIKFDFK